MQQTVTVTVAPNLEGAGLLRRISYALLGNDDEKRDVPTFRMPEELVSEEKPAKEMRDEGGQPDDKPRRKRRTKAEMEASKKGASSKDEGDDLNDDEQPLSPVISPDELERATGVSSEDEDDIDDGLDLGEEKKATSTLTVEGDLIPAFRAYAERYSRERAGKVLVKFGVKSVYDLDPAKYVEVLKILKA